MAQRTILVSVHAMSTQAPDGSRRAARILMETFALTSLRTQRLCVSMPNHLANEAITLPVELLR